MNRVFRRLAVWVVPVLVGLSAEPAWAQTHYPQRPVRLIVPPAPGAGGDIVARAPQTDLLEQPSTVEGRAAGAAVIGTDAVAKAAPLPDPLKDVDGVSLVDNSPPILRVNPKNIPAKKREELAAIGKSRPDRLPFGSSGLGSLLHPSSELFARTAGQKSVHRSYKGSGPADSMKYIDAQVQQWNRVFREAGVKAN